jgi:hypothetical protein
MILDLMEREANTEGSWENDIRGVQILEEKLSIAFTRAPPNSSFSRKT